MRFFLVVSLVFAVSFSMMIVCGMTTAMGSMVPVKNLRVVELVPLASQQKKAGDAQSKKQMAERSHGVVFNREPEFLQLPTYPIP